MCYIVRYNVPLGDSEKNELQLPLERSGPSLSSFHSTDRSTCPHLPVPPLYPAKPTEKKSLSIQFEASDFLSIVLGP